MRDGAPALLLALLTAGLVLGCPLSASIDRGPCAGEPQCVQAGVCDSTCVVRVDCCACLEELLCLDEAVDQAQCLGAMAADSVVIVDPGCDVDRERCGIACAGLEVDAEG